jgi:CBS domain-containing protein
MIAEHIQVRDVMTRGVVTVPLGATANDIVNVMAERDISGVAVVANSGEVVGIISEMDILKKLKERNWQNKCAEDLIAPSVESITPSSTLSEAAELMAKKHIHRLVVMSEKGIGGSRRTVGIISSSDIIKKLGHTYVLMQT